MPSSRPFLSVVTAFALIALAVGALTSSPSVAKSPEVFTGIVKGVAVGGYDPVAYFTDAKPVRGKPDIALDHGGVTWRFATAANRDAFKAEPAKYAPQFGGYCAWAVSQGYTAKGDPNAWTIVDGRLHLNYDKSVQATWEKDKPGNIAKGEANWPKVLAK